MELEKDLSKGLLNDAVSNEKWTPPKDNKVYYIMIILGAAILLPWNAVLNCDDFFTDKWPKSDYPDIMFWVSPTYIAPQLPILFLMVKYGARMSFNWRITYPMLLMTVTIALLPICAALLPTGISFFTTLGCCFFIGVFTAIIQSSVFGIGGIFPFIYMQGIMMGNGFAGVAMGLLKMGVKLIMDDVVKNHGHGGKLVGAFIFLAIGCGFLIFSVVSFKVLQKIPFFQYYIIVSSNDDGDESLLANDIENAVSIQDLDLLDKNQLMVEYKRRAYVARHEAEESNMVSDDDTLPTMQVFAKVIGPAMCVWLVFAGTFAGFPGEVLSIDHHGDPKFLDWMGGDWWAIWLVMIFNLMDTIGRTMPSKILFFNDKTMWIGAIARCALVYLFYLCVETSHFNDLWPIIFMILFSFSNGYTSTCAMMFGPAKVTDANKEKAGFLMSLLLQGGIFCGSVFSLVVFQNVLKLHV
eukprot:TRINITY_DN3367_c0_g1_i1.p1 TRINITY_DN3367_c0_g1~~TRINITY_DN3367_c0_g1_i1.p1  ORF type:complete len:466 (-),score=95.59 TRINITY_DN3367_c0_g1_i1:234-1631(-)